MFCDTATAPEWKAGHGSSVASGEIDYDRACKTSTYLDVIDVSQSQALILGDEPLQSTITSDWSGILIIRWISCRSEILMEDALRNIPQNLPEIEEPVFLRVNALESILFDAATLIHESKEQMTVDLMPGAYRISTELFKNAGSFEFLIHRFKKQ